MATHKQENKETSNNQREKEKKRKELLASNKPEWRYLWALLVGTLYLEAGAGLY